MGLPGEAVGPEAEVVKPGGETQGVEVTHEVVAVEVESF